MTSWQIRSDDSHTVAYNHKNGIVIELLNAGRQGWFQCRTKDWKMFTIYSDGKIDTPRVQVRSLVYRFLHPPLS